MTRRNYYSVWRTFNQFFICLDRKPNSWEDRLVLFVGFLANQEKKSTTIKSYISAVKAVLKEDGITLNENRFLLNAIMKGCHLVNDKVFTRLSIKKGLLILILKAVKQLLSDQTYLIVLYKAMLTTAYFGLFRIGEIAQSPHVVKAKDVQIGKNKNKLMFILRSLKTHCKDNEPQIIRINSSEFDPVGRRQSNYNNYNNHQIQTLCPFRTLQDYQAERHWKRNDNEQFFVFRDHTPVKPAHFRSILKKALIHLNLDSNLYNTHSLWSGRSVDLLVDMSISVEMIRKLG